MSDENVVIVRDALEYFAATEELAPAVAKDFVWDMSTFRGWPDEPLYEGWEAFYGFIAAWREPYDVWRYRIDNLLDAGDGRVLALLTQTGKLRGSDADVQLEFWILSTVRGGLIRRMQVYSEAAEALRDAGLVG
jgi:hypothetical protein